eukprot:COSAG02_NODE_43408_length_375_cov_0.717391_2_plen_48_part_01
MGRTAAVRFSSFSRCAILSNRLPATGYNEGFKLGLGQFQKSDVPALIK